jgi:hypothetical protein
MKGMRSKAVVLLVNSKTGDFQKMPIPVRQALANPELGSSIPRITVFDKKSENSLGSLAYKQLGDKKAMRGLENAMREYAKNGTIPGGAVEGKPDAGDEDSAESPQSLGKDGKISDPVLNDWTSSKGTKMKARATRFTDGKLTLMRENGTSVKIALNQLSDESRKVAEALIGQ